MNNRKSARWITTSVILWGICVGAAIIAFAWYDVRGFTLPKPTAHAPDVLPTKTVLVATVPMKPVVAMFVHPRCPCSKASLTEFTVLMRELQGKVEFRVIFFKPASQSLAWVQRDNLFARATAVSNLHVSIDEDGTEAARFNAETSGFVVAYAPDGALLFSGGITASRGHEGNNPGEAALLHAVRHYLSNKTTSAQQSASAPTFGCSILSNSTNTLSVSQ